MPTQDSTTADEALEACLDEIDALVGRLDRYPLTTLAVAMRVHLGNLLRALHEHGLCTRDESREFVRELWREATGAADE